MQIFQRDNLCGFFGQLNLDTNIYQKVIMANQLSKGERDES